MTPDRLYIIEAAQKAAGGTPLRRYSTDTVHGAGFCAQLVRETVEGGLGIRANTWDVSRAALQHSRARGASTRWATDYEAAARDLGLARPAAEMTPGDVLYWPYRAANGNNYGHTAIYLGDGLVLENSDANAAKLIQKGARQPFGKGTQVFVTPLKLRGAPSTVIYPTLEALRLEVTPPTPAPTPPVPVPLPTASPPLYLYSRNRDPDGALRGDWTSIAVDAEGRVLLGADRRPRTVYMTPEMAAAKGLG